MEKYTNEFTVEESLRKGLVGFLLSFEGREKGRNDIKKMSCIVVILYGI